MLLEGPCHKGNFNVLWEIDQDTKEKNSKIMENIIVTFIDSNLKGNILSTLILSDIPML